MTMIFPEATSVQGNTKITLFLTCADMTAPKLATEINAGTSVDASYFLRGFTPGITTNSGTAPPRLGTKTQLPAQGNTQLEAPELRYVYNPAAAAANASNKLKSLLTQGTDVYAVVRKGLDVTTAFAVGQYVEVWKFDCGPQNRTTSGDDEFAEFEISQTLFPLVIPVYDVTIVT